MESNLIKQVFEFENFIEFNGWFFKAQWKDIEIERFEDDNKWLLWKNGTWISGIWEAGDWESGTWKSGEWKEGVWDDGVWESGTWNSGEWKEGIWKGGKIYNPKTNEYIYSEVNPRECDWSLSYEG